MADALCREYHLGVLPTELMEYDLAPAKKLLVNARILSYRNEQAKLASQAPTPQTQNGPSLGDKIKAKRMKMQADRQREIRNLGLT